MTLRLYADFNDRNPDGGCWTLWHDGHRLEDTAAALGVTTGDTVILYQDENDFDVQATIRREHVGVLGQQAWVAHPDWSTLTRHATRDVAD